MCAGLSNIKALFKAGDFAVVKSNEANNKSTSI